MRLYDILDDVILHHPKLHEMACVVGDGEVCLYEQTLINGLQFPFPLFVRELLSYVGIAMAQLMPNSWQIVIGCMALWVAYSRGRDLIIV